MDGLFCHTHLPLSQVERSHQSINNLVRAALIDVGGFQWPDLKILSAANYEHGLQGGQSSVAPSDTLWDRTSPTHGPAILLEAPATSSIAR